MTKKILIATIAFFMIACASGHREPFKETLSPVRDLTSAQKRIAASVSDSAFLSFKEIGRVEYDGFNAPLWCVSFRVDEPVSYKILINAGIHGNEPAGVAFVLHLLEQLTQNPHQHRSVAMDLIPLVNPWGWVHDIRFNRDGIDINRDFSTFDSQESQIITKFLEDRHYDLMLDLHEDPSSSGFYVYQYGNDDISMAENLIDTIRNMGYPIEENVSMVILKTENGIIDAPMWGLRYLRITGQLSLANYYRLNNSQSVYTIETPTSLPLADRLIMQRTAVDGLITANTPDS
ncbi:MAG: M14 family metallocarboxypeptidase [Deltaproteobacteria bacterium]|jgi:hypothetical protein|nr:M14 family metallocarboxypeptidase [Deltaproteobacteria bacterium]